MNYTLSWDTEYWSLKNETNNSAQLTGPTQVGPWNLQIANDDSIPLGFATVYRAAYRYWYKMPVLGLTPPNFGRKVRIICREARTSPDGSAAGLFNSDPDFDEPDIDVSFPEKS